MLTCLESISLEILGNIKIRLYLSTRASFHFGPEFRKLVNMIGWVRVGPPYVEGQKVDRDRVAVQALPR